MSISVDDCFVGDVAGTIGVFEGVEGFFEVDVGRADAGNHEGTYSMHKIISTKFRLQ
jgi:hypothetical protein